MTMPMTNNAALDGGRETVVQFDHLQHVYPGGVEALKDINLSFRKGDIMIMKLEKFSVAKQAVYECI